MSSEKQSALPRDAGEGQWYARRWISLALLLASVFMDMVDSQIVTIALPTIQRHLHATPAALQWTVTGYTLAFALTLITGGRLGDKVGRRASFVAGTAGFAAASLLAGAAPNMTVLLTARALQGVCAGIMVPQVLAFIYAEFPIAEQGRAMGLFGMTFPLGGIAGPLLGGVLTGSDLFGWHWRTIFFVNVPIGLAAALGAALILPARRAASRTWSIDLSSLALLTAALLAALYPLVEGRALGWPAWSFVLLAASLPLGWLFVHAQRGLVRRGRQPLISPSLLATRPVAVGCLLMVIFYCGMGAFFVLTLHLQDGLGYSPMKAALALVPATAGIGAGNAAGMPLVATHGRRIPMAGLAVLILSAGAGMFVVGHYGTRLNPWELIVPVVLFGLGLGLGSSSLMLIAISGARPGDAGAASGLVNTVVQLGTAAGPATIGTLFFARLPQHGYPDATQLALASGAVLFAAALLVCLLLPKPPARPHGAGGETSATTTAQRVEGSGRAAMSSKTLAEGPGSQPHPGEPAHGAPSSAQG
jgi:EmrB/QacA subfamily drug resistance transporter